MWNQKPCFRFEIDNLSEKKAVISSKTFVSGGCEWYLDIYPKGDRLANVGQGVNLYCASHPSWGFGKVLPVSKFQEKGFLEKDKLIIEVYIKVIEAFDGEEVSNNKKNKTVDINGFQVFASQVTKVGKIFTDHPDIALDVKPTKQEVKTAYMHVLLRVIKTLNKPPKSLSDTRLNKASSDLSELMDVGFKLDWLKLKFDEVSLERKKADDTNESRAQRLEKRAKKLELMELDFKLDSLNRKKADDTKESLDKEVEKRAAQIELGFNRRLNKKLGDLERKRSYDTSVFDSQIKQIEGHVMGLGLKLDSLNTKLEEMSKEKKKADDDADVTLVQELKNLELMVSDIKVELDKKKNISSDDGFLLVD